MLHLHNLLRWVILILAVVTLVRSLSGMNGKKAFTAADKKTALFFMISCDIQLLVGLSLYFSKGWFGVLTSGSEFMKLPAQRFFALEHLVGMIIAIAMVHIGYAATKKNIADSAKFKKLFIFTLLALVIMLATIPWPFREAIARPLFPGM
jgi:hypothetical protein